ncbi:hypothetical protein [Kordiimonas aestuarii]|uniref:hypothetical protein n=1 Tax=Kordiimonas aestuarii TaxID=1005925 RepID=UPI0021CE09D8|nr:hypothetical protein [Kordiimonas aestuarii]
MKIILRAVIAVIFICFSAESYASQEKAFSAMTLTELEHVNTDVLSKADKKLYKKAIKAAKRAEKRRLKAEEKRLKAERKAREKARKAMAKRVDFIRTIRDNTRIIQDDFEAYTLVRGGGGIIHNMDTIYMLGNGGEIVYRLRTRFFPETGNMEMYAYLVFENRQIVDQETMAAKRLTPVEYGRRYGMYPGYSTAKMHGGAEREVTRYKPTGEVSFGIGTFWQDFKVHLTPEDVLGGIDTGIEFKLAGGNMNSFVIRIPADYLMGYFLKFSELGPEFATYMEKLNEKFAALEAAAGE